MAPWWLRSSSDEEASEDSSQAPEDRRDDEDEEGAEGESFEVGWDDEEDEAADSADDDQGADDDAEEEDAEEEEDDDEDEDGDGEEGSEDGEEGSADGRARPKRRKRRRRRRRKSDNGGSREGGSRDGGGREDGGERPAKASRGERPAKASRGDQLAFDASSPPAFLSPAAEAVDSELAPAAYPRDVIYALPDRGHDSDERAIAMFCDFENLALGLRDSEAKDSQKFDIHLVLARLLEKGKVIVKKAYADWTRYSEYKRPFHEAAIELIDIPKKRYSGKNSADIKMVVDAMDLSYSKEHLDTFAIVSGDSDFSPLVSKLRENDKYVIGIGIKNSTSQLLVDNCDEFIYYEDVWRDGQKAPRLDGLSKQDAEVFGLMVDAMLALIRENKEVLWGSMIKQTMKRKRPSFNEGYYGYGSFSELLEDAQRKNLIRLKRDRRAGTYVVTGFAR